MNWKIASTSYHDKKKSKLWISVLIEDIDNYIEKYEHFDCILCMVEFNKENEPKINYSIPNCRGLKSVALTDSQKEMVLQSAVEKARQYQ